jgi:hypothetical protein
MIILLTPLVQTSYGDNDTIVVSATNENKVVLFNISSGTDSPAIYGFIITIYGHGHYSEITKSPDGWASGIIGNQAVIWTTQSHPIQPGSSEGNFAIEVTQASIYNIGWSVTDNTLKPVAWGTITITVS